MSPTTTDFAAKVEVNLAFVIRLTKDQASDSWRILLKPVNGQKPRLFSDVESALLYLETVMQKEHP